MTTIPTFQTVTFTRWGADESVLANAARTKTVTARDRVHAQELADIYGKTGWLLKSIVETNHVTNVFYGGPTFSGNHKWNWVFECTCGDEDASSSKQYADEIALAHLTSLR